MKRLFVSTLAMGILVAAAVNFATAEDAKDEAIKKDRALYEGTWRIVALEINGKDAQDDGGKNLTVVNGSDGTWRILSQQKEISRGTSEIDPIRQPKTIDFSPTVGGDKGKRFLGIYEIGETTRRLCFAPPGKDRPTEFASKPDSGQILVTFERVESE